MRSVLGLVPAQPALIGVAEYPNTSESAVGPESGLREPRQACWKAAMAGYGQFCSVARAHEVLGGRWTLLVVREPLCGSSRFSDIRRGIPRISGAGSVFGTRGL